MPAYLLTFGEVTDPAMMGAYAQKAGPTMAQHGGKMLVLGSGIESLEGDGAVPQSVGIFEFESVEQLKKWYHSPEYQEAAKLRKQAGTFTFTIVEGRLPGR